MKRVDLKIKGMYVEKKGSVFSFRTSALMFVIVFTGNATAKIRLDFNKASLVSLSKALHGFSH